jgi:hypothetical protein
VTGRVEVAERAEVAEDRVVVANCDLSHSYYPMQRHPAKLS